MVFRIIIVGLLLSGCASFGHKIGEVLLVSGIAKTTGNQNYKKILNEGRFLLFGNIQVYYNRINITESNHCGIGVNGTVFTRGVAIFQDKGDFIIDLDEKDNYWGVIACGMKSDLVPVRINYEFKNIDFKLNGRVGYLGSIKLYLTDEKISDNYKKYENLSPWLEEVDYDPNDLATMKRIEESYKIKGDHLIDIGLK